MRTNNGGSGESPLFGSFDSPCRRMQNTAHGGVAPRHHHVSWEHALHDELTQSRGQSGMLGLHTRMYLGGELAKKCAAGDQLKVSSTFLLDFHPRRTTAATGAGGRCPAHGEKYFSFIYFFPKGTIAGAVETIQSSTAVRSFIGGGQVQRKWNPPSLATEQPPQDEAIQDGQITSVLVMACDGWRSGHGVGVLLCRFDAFHTALGTYAKKSRIRSFVQVHCNQRSRTKYTV
ncbi:uncharacterized protein BO87DRAFT_399277 [Aspergillus neoniger CBS 115656]|uniref:Uncharacterized protein n=1 Tax=Aspergillus neoniger (strain CBS 115656) TaxID=1448310 RepID=A0A318YCU8_ASPNB|nr:hypothetical protein BO87DRAFT_399277 [Aspergillus neoniger CBS 115656]PYH31824.1 hypothetical protein BO87DRAFT_399277 [Aspergillus neoniger CBS 115656]